MWDDVSKWHVSGEYILKTKRVPDLSPMGKELNLVMVSYEGDKRFDDLVNYAGQIGASVKRGDKDELRKLLPKGSDLDVNILIQDHQRAQAKENKTFFTEVGEAIVGRHFHSKMKELNGLYDKPMLEMYNQLDVMSEFKKAVFGIDPKNPDPKREAEFAEFHPKIAMCIKEIATHLHMMDNHEGSFRQIVKTLEKNQNKVIDLFKDYNLNPLHADALLYQLHHAKPEELKKMVDLFKGESTKEGVEYTKDIGKGSPNPQRGFVCRHYGPEMAAMYTAMGSPAVSIHGYTNKFGHSVVLTENNNVADPANDSSFIYGLGINSSLRKFKSGEPLMYFNGQNIFVLSHSMEDSVKSYGEKAPEIGIIAKENGGQRELYIDQMAKDGSTLMDFRNPSSPQLLSK